MFGAIDHVGVAVSDLEAAISLYEGSFGMELVHRETVVSEQGVEAVLLDVGDSHVELLSPTGPDTPVGKFLSARGEGLHHVAYRVDDIDATLDGAARPGRQAHRPEAANGDPVQPGRLPSSQGNRRGADGDRRAGGRALTFNQEE